MNPIGYFLSHLQFECNTTMFLLFVQVSLLLFRCSSECIIECQPLKNMLFLYIVKMMSMIMLVSATFDARNASVINREENHTSLVNSGFWVSIELFISLNQIIAAIVVLSLSKNEKPEIALFTWVIGYILGCITTVSHICWRYHTRSENQDIEQESNIQRYICISYCFSSLLVS